MPDRFRFPGLRWTELGGRRVKEAGVSRDILSKASRSDEDVLAGDLYLAIWGFLRGVDGPSAGVSGTGCDAIGLVI